ncbi:hypothetical protein [Brevibacillus formosus]|uniref:hypothetical protein n=1 Tax=Brevibacillus formosus TaxID=54913 RepID=UPI003F1CF384
MGERSEFPVYASAYAKRMVVKTFLRETSRVVVVLNTQFTNAPNTTQIASGAGRSSAAGNDAAIDSANTLQQQSVGAGGIARNRGMNNRQKVKTKAKARKGKRGFRSRVARKRKSGRA